MLSKYRGKFFNMFTDSLYLIKQCPRHRPFTVETQDLDEIHCGFGLI